MTTAAAVHAHHWLIEALPVDGVLPARCKHCTATRTYPPTPAPRRDMPSDLERALAARNRMGSDAPGYLVRPI